MKREFDSASTYKNGTIYMLASLVLFVVVMAAVIYHGYQGRAFAVEKATFNITSPEEAYGVWKRQKVNGRILLLCDIYPHLQGRIGYDESPQITRSNVIEFSVFENIIRKIYLVVPEAQWQAFEKRDAVRPIRRFTKQEKGLYLYSLNGIPLIAVTPGAIPEISEEVLVYINNAVFSDAEIMELLSKKKIASDILISYKGDQR